MPPVRGSGKVRYEVLDDYGAIIAQLRIGDRLYMGFQAPYAHRLEYGFTGTDSLGRKYNQSGRHFVGSAALRWDTIVAEQAAKLQGAVAARQGA